MCSSNHGRVMMLYRQQHMGFRGLTMTVLKFPILFQSGFKVWLIMLPKRITNDFSGRPPFSPSDKILLTSEAVHHNSFISWISRDPRDNITMLMYLIQLWSNKSSLISNRCLKEKGDTWLSTVNNPLPFLVKKTFECHCLSSRWWHQTAHHSLLTLFCEM